MLQSVGERIWFDEERQQYWTRTPLGQLAVFKPSEIQLLEHFIFQIQFVMVWPQHEHAVIVGSWAYGGSSDDGY